jgi:hypothetical protein
MNKMNYDILSNNKNKKKFKLLKPTDINLLNNNYKVEDILNNPKFKIFKNLNNNKVIRKEPDYTSTKIKKDIINNNNNHHHIPFIIDRQLTPPPIMTNMNFVKKNINDINLLQNNNVKNIEKFKLLYKKEQEKANINNSIINNRISNNIIKETITNNSNTSLHTHFKYSLMRKSTNKTFDEKLKRNSKVVDESTKIETKKDFSLCEFNNKYYEKIKQDSIMTLTKIDEYTSQNNPSNKKKLVKMIDNLIHHFESLKTVLIEDDNKPNM